ALLAASISVARPAAADFPGTNGLIVFSTNLSDGLSPPDPSVTDTEIFTLDPANPGPTHFHQLTRNADADGAPRWSPDGTKIAFDSNRSDGNYEIYVMDANGSNVLRLTHDAANDISPVWSPNGKKLAFVSNRHTGSFSDIYIMDARDRNNDGNGDH